MKHQIVAIFKFTSVEDELYWDLIEDFHKFSFWLKKNSCVYGDITSHATQGGKMIGDGWRKSQDKEAFGRYKPIKTYLTLPEDRIRYEELNYKVKSTNSFVGNRFQLIFNKCFEESHQQLKSIGASSFGELTHQESIEIYQFISNLSFTFGDFHSTYYKDQDLSNYSYGILMLVDLKNFNLVKNKEDVLCFSITTNLE
ncbi:hypothetical protein O181_012176 [Austropuccinia psidii MF-1]|uniref:Tet-like 2OG-Fe(II) oxygenase domain-containing protein n=1 Tax=Austropuccinia psidii MF-1 TaxID=1389203 RepID=A0A9Q3BX96_9BASI|nr:hypothetical protein [Austropuccinia psidii MF-1]